MKMKEVFGTAGESSKIYSLPTAKFAVRRVKNEPLHKLLPKGPISGGNLLEKFFGMGGGAPGLGITSGRKGRL